MKFMDVVRNGVLQAWLKLPRGPGRRGKAVSNQRARRLLAYKGERVARSIARGPGRLQVIFD